MLLFAVGCGGTNTTDGTAPYNRSGNGMDPSGLNPSSSPQELAAVYGMVQLPALPTSESDAKATVDQWVTLYKKLTSPPRKVFAFGLSSSNVNSWVKALSEIKVDLIPVPQGQSKADWDKILKVSKSEKFFGNGPSTAEPNLDRVLTDQKKLSSTFSLDGVRFVVWNTQTPLAKAGGAGENVEDRREVPRLWLGSRLKDTKEKSIVILGQDPAYAQTGLKQISTNDPFLKNPNIRLYFSPGAEASISRPEGETVYQVVLPSSSPSFRIGLLEIRKNQAVQARLVEIKPDLTSQSLTEVVVFEPTNSLISTKPKTEAKPKNESKTGAKPETAAKPKDKNPD